MVETCKTGEIRDTKGRFLPGVSGNPDGMPAGVRNKASQIKQAFYEAFERIGGVEELVKWIKEEDNKKDFFKLLLSILPKELQHENLDDVIPQTKIVVVYNDGNKVQPDKETDRGTPLPNKQ